jgi:hypothetical protein
MAEALREDDRAIVRAASAASKAADYRCVSLPSSQHTARWLFAAEDATRRQELPHNIDSERLEPMPHRLRSVHTVAAKRP